MSITTVLFDLDDTLLKQADSDWQALRATAEQAGLSERGQAARLCRAVRRQARGQWQQSPHTDYVNNIGISPMEGLWARFLGPQPAVRALRAWALSYPEQVWSAALRAVGVDDPPLARQLAVQFGAERRRHHVVFRETVATLRTLGGSLRLGLVTNGTPCLQREKIVGAGLGGYFDAIIISGELGVGKPDPAVFAAALERLGARAAETAMVGDNPDRDILGGRAAGLARTIWVRRGAPAGRCRVQPDAVVPNLTALADVL